MRSQQLRQLIGEVDRHTDIEVNNYAVNDNWEYIDISCDASGSEMVAVLAKQYDFDFCSVDFEKNTIRLNRQK